MTNQKYREEQWDFLWLQLETAMQHSRRNHNTIPSCEGSGLNQRLEDTALCLLSSYKALAAKKYLYTVLDSFSALCSALSGGGCLRQLHWHAVGVSPH